MRVVISLVQSDVHIEPTHSNIALHPQEGKPILGEIYFKVFQL